MSTSSLYFARGDQFEDPYEGMPPDEYIDAVRHGGTNLGPVPRQIRMFHHYRADYFVNCWHLSPHETFGMWKLYAGIDAGIALRTMYSRLQHAFAQSRERLFLGLTSYKPEHVFGPTNQFKFSSYKRSVFDYEQEVRAIIWRPSEYGYVPSEDEDAPVAWPLPERSGPRGIHVKLPIEELLIEIVVSPTAPLWFPDVLRDVIRMYGFEIPVRQSSVNRLSYVRYED
jgi:hypothetical protein